MQCPERPARRGDHGGRRRGRRRSVVQPRTAAGHRALPASPPAQRRGSVLVDARRRRRRRQRLRHGEDVRPGAPRRRTGRIEASADRRGVSAGGGRRSGGNHLRAVPGGRRRRQRRLRLVGTPHVDPVVQRKRTGTATGRRHPADLARLALQRFRPFPLPLQSKFHLPPQRLVGLNRKRKSARLYESRQRTSRCAGLEFTRALLRRKFSESYRNY